MVLDFSVPMKTGTVYSKGGFSLGFCIGQKVWVYVHVHGFFLAFHGTKPESLALTPGHLFLLYHAIQYNVYFEIQSSPSGK